MIRNEGDTKKFEKANNEKMNDIIIKSDKKFKPNLNPKNTLGKLFLY